METIKYIGIKELANALSVSVSTINRKLNEIPHRKLGDARTSRVIFSVPEINEYLEERRIPSKMSVE